MKKPSKERERKEQELLYLLRLFNELQGREGVTSVLYDLEQNIAQIVELLKIL